MKFYLGFISNRREQRNKIISGLIIASSICIAVVIGISIGAIFIKSMGALSIIKEESDAAVNTVKRKSNHVLKDIRERKNIISGGIKTGFKQIYGNINKTVKKISNDLK